jgi:hypothetical protein
MKSSSNPRFFSFNFVGSKFGDFFQLQFFSNLLFLNSKNLKMFCHHSAKSAQQNKLIQTAKDYTTMGAMRAQGDTLCKRVGW